MNGNPLSPQRSAEFAARYRNAALMLGLAVLLLVATAVYLVVRDRTQIWATAHRNQQDVATAMQASITELLAQSVLSIQGIRTDLNGRTAPSRAEMLDALRLAMRFDPLSTYLGVRTDQGLLLADAAGEVRLDPAAHQQLPGIEPVPADTPPRLGALVQFGGDRNWYLPVYVDLPAGAKAAGVVFALVPAQRLLSFAASLRVLPGSYVTVFSTDGMRLMRAVEGESFEANGRRVPDAVMALIAATPSGSFARPSTVDGRPTIYGYSTSDTLPLIVSTGVPESALQGQWLGKSMTPFLMLLAGVFAIVVFAVRLRSALREQRDYMATQEYMASHDQLTGLPNRYAFMRFVDGLIERCGPGDAFHVLLLDLNNFKDVNDTLGHAAGDSVLEAVGQRLGALLAGQEACVARLGGDEIAICAPNLASADAGAVLRFCEEIERCLGQLMVIQNVELAVTASIGVAAFPADARTSTELLRCADIAMYSAKADLSSHCLYLETMDHFTPDALAMKAEFAKAIREDTLTLVYQPKLRLGDKALVGLEALSRWVHPTKGPIAPVRFMPLAETTELIHPFTELVLKNAVGQIARWLALGHAVPVAVNISANNLLEHRFAETLRARLAESRVPAHLLELEVTESAVMRYPETMLKRLHDIRSIGVKLSIDDFGTGYASLAYLKQLPVDTLKIDKVFITHIDSDHGDRRIVRSSIQLAHGFGMTVVAEGVETQRAADFLHAEGCDFAQGFHFAKPLSAGEIEAQWLSRLAGRGNDEAAREPASEIIGDARELSR